MNESRARHGGTICMQSGVIFFRCGSLDGARAAEFLLCLQKVRLQRRYFDVDIDDFACFLLHASSERIGR